MTPAQIDELAEMYQVVRGKWMCFPTTAQADAVWRQLATALVSGGLGAATEDKIAPRFEGLRSLFFVGLGFHSSTHLFIPARSHTGEKGCNSCSHTRLALPYLLSDCLSALAIVRRNKL